MNVALRAVHRPIVPPVASAGFARRTRSLARTLATIESCVHLPWPDGGILEVKRVAVAEAAFGKPRHTYFRFGDGPTAAVLVIETGFARALVMRLFGSDPDPTAAASGRPLSLAERGALGAVIAGIGHRLGWPLRLHLEPAARAVPTSAGESAPSSSQAVEVLIEVKLMNPTLGTDLAGRAAVRWIPTEHFSGEPAPCPAAPLHKVPFPVVLELARTRLFARDLDGLDPGDVVLFSDARGSAPNDSGGRVLWLRVGMARAPAHHDGETGRMRLVGDFVSDVASEGATMHDETSSDNHDPHSTPTAFGPAAHAALAHAPVEVVAEVGRLTLTGAEIAGLCRGMVLALGRPAVQPVVLTVAGRPIARGTLVEIEGDLGVRVEETLL